ncbi:hypothetical protein Y032_0483g2303 [Ancylostoma ceylanicum]|nr:hypothetical protein Y032_0483g2303 [Ancylostoma ceylanicum]
MWWDDPVRLSRNAFHCLVLTAWKLINISITFGSLLIVTCVARSPRNDAEKFIPSSLLPLAEANKVFQAGFY